MDIGEIIDRGFGSTGKRRAHIVFTGRGREYFSVWIVNVLLTIATLGIYLAWAKVRTRRYFTWNTFLEGHHFDYLAGPRSILIGHVIVFGGMAAVYAAREWFTALGAVITLAAYAAVPWLIYKALRFRARNTAYRGVRFRFLGTPGRAYLVYGLIPGPFLVYSAAAAIYAATGAEQEPAFMTYLASLSAILGIAAFILYPYWMYLRKKYAYGNISFGATRSIFRGEVKFFYKAYVKTMFMAALAVFVALAGVFAVTGALVFSGGLASGAGIAAFLVPAMVGAAAYFTFEQYLYATVTNHCLNNLTIGKISFSCDIDPLRLVFIRLTNVAASALTLGILIPWAVTRRYAYVTGRITVIGADELDGMKAGEDADQSAAGDAALDYFDMDVGW